MSIVDLNLGGTVVVFYSMVSVDQIYNRKQ